MSRRKPKLEYAIICDDIRQEVGHKLSYIGIYGLDITVPGLPFTFPQICAAISYRNLKGGDFFTISGKDPSGRDLGKKEKVCLIFYLIRVSLSHLVRILIT